MRRAVRQFRAEGQDVGQAISQGCWAGGGSCPVHGSDSVGLVPFRIHPLKIHGRMPESVILGPVRDFWVS